MAVLYGASFALHASLGFGVTEIEPEKEPERIAITVVSAPKPKPKPKVEEPPPPPPPPPPVEAAPKKAAPKPKVAEAPKPAPTPAPASAPTFGIAMTGGVGLGGVAVPVGHSLSAAKEPPKRVAEAKTLTEPKRAVESGCSDPASKPKPIQMPRPAYSEEARAASIEGRVRVELTIDASGAVQQAKVLEALGHGLDEAALEAVRAATFEPARQCGKPVSATFVVSIRFTS
jgi:periplasmic protein TonB